MPQTMQEEQELSFQDDDRAFISDDGMIVGPKR